MKSIRHVAVLLLAFILFTQTITPVFAIPCSQKINGFRQYDITTVTIYDERYDAPVDEDKKEFTKVPLFNQQDYTETPYSQGTIATSGCGITCVAMVGSYYRNEFVSPDDLGKQFNGSADNNVDRMENASEFLDLPLREVTWYWSKAHAALKEGAIVISLQKKGLFTSEGHFIVLTGINEEGKIMVNDPFGYNWTKSDEMIEGFANGFTIEQITDAEAAYWIYEPKYPSGNS